MDKKDLISFFQEIRLSYGDFLIMVILPNLLSIFFLKKLTLPA